MGNPVVYFEIAVTDIGKSSKFYADLFDWSYKVDEKDQYHEVGQQDGVGISGGLFQTKPEEFPPNVTVYVKVDNIQTYLDKATELGGEVVLGSTPIPNVGTIAMFKDLSGNVMGLYQGVENG